ncbi:MAG: EthD family reductase [Proteobacteria bacterium]|nr:EthD family reductase [Pseudomonadota bacterium]
MIKVSILYPRDPGSRFDFDYYTRKHMPLAIALLSHHPGFRAASVERAMDGVEPETSPAYIAGCFFTFDTVDSFFAAFTRHADELQADVRNYTDIEPLIQFNEVLITAVA